MIPNYIEGLILTVYCYTVNCFNINIHVFNNCILLLAKVFPNDKYKDTRDYTNAQDKTQSITVLSYLVYK